MAFTVAAYAKCKPLPEVFHLFSVAHIPDRWLKRQIISLNGSKGRGRFLKARSGTLPSPQPAESARGVTRRCTDRQSQETPSRRKLAFIKATMQVTDIAAIQMPAIPQFAQVLPYDQATNDLRRLSANGSGFRPGCRLP